MAMGHGLTSGQTDVIRPGDLGMKRIKSMIFQPWGDPRTADRRLIFMQGSISSLEVEDTSSKGANAGGSVAGNYVRYYSQQLTGTGASAAYPGTFQIGSMNPGTVRYSFFAAGV
jgi:hypothetical protein